MPQDIKLQKAEDGKGLSTHDYTEEAKAKVDAIPENPKYTDTVYTPPESYPASMITESTTRRFVSDTEKAEWNGKAPATHTHDYAPATHTHTAAQVTQSTTARFVTDDEKTTWNNKIGKEGGSMTGALVANPSDDTRQMRNIAIGTTAPTSTTGHSEGDIWLVVP